MAGTKEGACPDSGRPIWNKIGDYLNFWLGDDDVDDDSQGSCAVFYCALNGCRIVWIGVPAVVVV